MIVDRVIKFKQDHDYFDLLIRGFTTSSMEHLLNSSDSPSKPTTYIITELPDETELRVGVEIVRKSTYGFWVNGATLCRH